MLSRASPTHVVVAVPFSAYWTPQGHHGGHRRTQHGSLAAHCEHPNMAQDDDEDMADALRLLQRPSMLHDSTPCDVAPLPSPSRASTSEAERRAKHSEVQRRFMKRKHDNHMQLKSETERLERQYSYLQGIAELKKLHDERALLALNCRLLGLHEDTANGQPKRQDPSQANPPLFDFDLTNERTES